MAGTARGGQSSVAIRGLPWVVVAGTLFVLLAVVFRTPMLFRLGIGFARGLVISFVVPDSSAATAGLQVGDTGPG